jgi:antitoxin (DNA-binding transcriptional repressor) of toxin-antitoxin stability system
MDISNLSESLEQAGAAILEKPAGLKRNGLYSTAQKNHNLIVRLFHSVTARCTVEEINATQAARHFSDLLNRVAYQGASFELTRGGCRIARLVPAGPPKRVEVSELNSIFAGIPSLEDDAESFERDIADTQDALVPDGDPWDD